MIGTSCHLEGLNRHQLVENIARATKEILLIFLGFVLIGCLSLLCRRNTICVVFYLLYIRLGFLIFGIIFRAFSFVQNLIVDAQ